MALTKEDLHRATSIMGSILTELEDPLDVFADLAEEERESLAALQDVLDIVQSPLFSAIVDIRDQCKKSVQDSERWNEAADVRVTDTADVVAQFKERYNIAGVQELRNGSKTASALPDHLIDDTNIPPGDQPHIEPALAHDTYHLPLFPRHSQEDYGSTLNAEHQYTPSVSSNDSCSSSGSKRKKGRRQAGDRGVTLGHLARDTSQVALKTLQGQELCTARQRNSEISLSSLLSEASPPPLPPSLPPDMFSEELASPISSTQAMDKEEELTESEISESNHPKDILFFMRDKKSMTDLRATLNGKWGRGRREVVLPRQSHDSIGLELCGLSNTGVYVAAVTEPTLADRLQIGDQIMEIDGHTTENMAWFEVGHFMQGVSETQLQLGSGKGSGLNTDKQAGVEESRQSGETIILVVQYNPAGMGEVKRMHKTKS